MVRPAPVSRPLLIGLLAAAAAGACGGSPPGDADDGDIDRGAETAAPPPDAVRRLADQRATWEGQPRLELTREIRGEALPSGRTAGSPGLAFGSIRDLATAAGGGLLVLDGSESRVVALDSVGVPIGRVGGRGPGPGELRTPARVEAAPGGGVLVLERRPPAIHRWKGGEYRGAVTLERDVSSETPDGSPTVTELADWGPALPGGRAVRLLRLDGTDPSASGSAVYYADAAGRIGPPLLTWVTPGTRSRLPEVFGARRSWTAGAGPDGDPRFAVARGDRYEIRLHDASGDLRTVIRRDVRPTPVTDELRERALDRFTEEARRAGAPTAMIRDLRDELPVAETLPVIGGVWHSRPDDRLWVGIPGPGAPGASPVTNVAYDVYGPALEYLGRVPAPPGFTLHRVQGSRLLGSWRDSMGIPGIRTYRLIQPRH